MQGDLHEGFMWTDPVFTNQDDCKQWVNNHPLRILQTLNYYYPHEWQVIKSVCVREDKLETLKLQPYIEGKNI